METSPWQLKRSTPPHNLTKKFHLYLSWRKNTRNPIKALTFWTLLESFYGEVGSFVLDLAPFDNERGREELKGINFQLSIKIPEGILSHLPSLFVKLPFSGKLKNQASSKPPIASQKLNLRSVNWNKNVFFLHIFVFAKLWRKSKSFHCFSNFQLPSCILVE